jgi:hypothetical protein
MIELIDQMVKITLVHRSRLLFVCIETKLLHNKLIGLMNEYHKLKGT